MKNEKMKEKLESVLEDMNATDLIKRCAYEHLRFSNITSPDEINKDVVHGWIKQAGTIERQS